MIPPAGYAPLDVGRVSAYLAERPEWSALVGSSEPLVKDVGDGNLNLVFVVRAASGEPGVVLKQSLPWVRVHGESWPLTLERAAREAHAYEVYAPFADDLVPAYYGFDPTGYVLAIEDLGDLRVWRAALNDGEVHAGTAAAMGTLVARAAFWTSDLGMAAEQRRLLAAASVNPELCKITEDLVLTEPYVEHEHNWHHPALQPLVDQLRADDAVRLVVADLKHRFLTHGEALIHGDLHTGSVMVGDGRAVAIDPEFAFYGPVGFDLGALWANAIIAAARADRLDRDPAFREHVAAIWPQSWESFRAELERLWPQRVDRTLPDRFLNRRLAEIWADGVGYAGAKAVRRMIGYAHVSDIETLDEPQRSSAAAAVLRAARSLLLERSRLTSPADAWERVMAALAEDRDTTLHSALL